MNRLKVAVEALRDYLNRDTEGVRLLEDVVRIANDQRKRFSELEPARQKAESLAESLRTELAAAQLKIEQLQADVLREEAMRTSAQHREQAANERVLALQEPPEPVAVGGFRNQLERLGRIMTRRYNRLPKAHGCGTAIVVDDFVKGFQYDEFANLGMIISYILFMGMPIAVRAEHCARDEPEWDNKYMAKFCFWFNNYMSKDSTADKIMYASGLMSGPCPGID